MSRHVDNSGIPHTCPVLLAGLSPFGRVCRDLIQMNNESKNLIQNEPFRKADLARCFNMSDIGKVFWRVGSYGSLTQCVIHEITENNEAVIKNSLLTDLSNQEYRLNDVIKHRFTSTYGAECLRDNNEYYYNLDEAKKASLERFNKEVNPDGKYRVARYFDDIFEKYETDALPKKEAQLKCNELNSRPRAYVYYAIKSIE